MAGQADSGSSGAGQQQPGDSNSDLTAAIFLTRQLIAQIETMLPVQVVAVHTSAGSPPVTGTVDVQLLVNLLDGSGNATEQGVVYGLPYFRLQGGAWAIICDPAAGDFGFIIAASRDISNVVKNPGQQVPGSLRQYSYSDGIYIGGCLNEVPAATLWLKSDGTFNISDQPGNSMMSSSSGIVVTTAAGGDFTVNGISVTKHTHAVTTAPGETGIPTG